MSAPYLDASTVKELLHYEPESGVFTWLPRKGKKTWNTRYAGKEAGFDWTPTGSGVSYRSIRIFDWPFLGHRLAFLYMTGEWPAHEVDHADGDGLNNKWANLRAASKAQNGANCKAKKNNKSGFKGVSYCKATNKFRATIQAEGKWKWLGGFSTAEEAAEAYAEASKSLHGEFGRVS